MSPEASTSSQLSSPLTWQDPELSVKLYEETLKPRLETILKSETTLERLVTTAEIIVNENLGPNPANTFTWNTTKKEISVRFDEIMLAMLSSAAECGGERGTHYVAAAICSCSEHNDVVGAVVALGTTWLTHFLFLFRIGSWRCKTNSSEPTTPTSDETTPLEEEEEDEVLLLEATFAADVVKRDGYECVLTGYHSAAHEPPPTAGAIEADLAAAHILRKTFGGVNEKCSSNSHESSMIAFDILANFTSLRATTLEELSADLDGPSNGITLEPYAHSAFDKYHWCLKATEEQNVYALKVFRSGQILNRPVDDRIAFTDHSCSLADPDAPSVALPHPGYIAIHAAIAEIFNASGAGNFFNEVLRDCQCYEDRVSAVGCWSDLERLAVEVCLRDSITQSFQAAGVWHREQS